MMKLESIRNRNNDPGYPIRHQLQVGSVSFVLQKGLCRRDKYVLNIVYWWFAGKNKKKKITETINVQDLLCCLQLPTKDLLSSECRVALVFENIWYVHFWIARSDRACHSEFLNLLQMVMSYLAASKRFGDFCREICLSVRISLALFCFGYDWLVALMCNRPLWCINAGSFFEF